jgi:hypothetical protein
MIRVDDTVLATVTPLSACVECTPGLRTDDPHVLLSQYGFAGPLSWPCDPQPKSGYLHLRRGSDKFGRLFHQRISFRSTYLERGTGSFQKFRFLFRRLPSQNLISVGVTSELVNDSLVLQLELQVPFQPWLTEQPDRYLMNLK